MSYIPTKEEEADFLDWSTDLIAVSKTNVDVGKLPQDQLIEIEALHNEVKALHEVCQTIVLHQTEERKRVVFIKKEEAFVRNKLQNNNLGTDNVRKQLWIPIYDLISTTAAPLLRTLRFRFSVENVKCWESSTVKKRADNNIFSGVIPWAKSMNDYLREE
jgi:hypothetical protein